MENLKVKVNNEAESKEVQGLFFELGYEKGACSTGNYPAIIVTGKSWNTGNYCSTRALEFNCSAHKDHKELTIPQLRDMVVLKRNCVDDATHGCDGVNGLGVCLSGIWYAYNYNDLKWELWSDDFEFKKRDLKPIEKKEMTIEDLKESMKGSNWKIIAMKEFLVNHGNKWTLQLLDSDTEENSYRVAVPSEATFYAEDSNMGVKGDYFFRLRSDDFDDEAIYLNGNWMRASFDVRNMTVLWQRSETASINDQYAEIEQVRQETVKVTIDELKHRVGVDATLAERQATYGSFEDVAFVTENVMSVLSKARPNGLSDLPHTHRMALYMIASKMARIVNGDFNHIDGWHDIGGYSKLIENLIGDEDA